MVLIKEILGGRACNSLLIFIAPPTYHYSLLTALFPLTLPSVAPWPDPPLGKMKWQNQRSHMERGRRLEPPPRNASSHLPWIRAILPTGTIKMLSKPLESHQRRRYCIKQRQGGAETPLSTDAPVRDPSTRSATDESKGGGHNPPTNPTADTVCCFRHSLR